jgi:hypothetical protein
MNLPPDQVRPFLTSLTPVTLRTDTVVTNHGFTNGVARPFQSVLQAGTAVLVDPQGLPRVRCYCGNPLGVPDQPTAARYTGAAWNGFSGDAVAVVAKAPTEVRDFVVVKPEDDGPQPKPDTGSGTDPVTGSEPEVDGDAKVPTVPGAHTDPDGESPPSDDG